MSATLATRPLTPCQWARGSPVRTQEYVMDYVVALSALSPHLRERVPEVDGQWIVTDGAPPAGCLLGRLASGELVYLVDYVGDDGEGIAQYAGWAIVSDRP